MTHSEALLPILGSISGDIIGSVYEWNRIKTKNFPLIDPDSFFTDDTVMTIAIAEAMMTDRNFQGAMIRWGKRYPSCSYGGMFSRWLSSGDPKPYNSFGNGAAMRASAAGCFVNTEDETLEAAKQTALPSHNHPEGIKGAQATAMTIFLARTGASKPKIKKLITEKFGYDLKRPLDDIRPEYGFDETCQRTVPEAIICFLESTDYEDAVRNAISLGGDSDTLACITGGFAAAYYKKIPDVIIDHTMKKLKPDMTDVLHKINSHFAG